MVDPMPMMTMFDKGITMRMGQATVKAWIPDLLPLVSDHGDPLADADQPVAVPGARDRALPVVAHLQLERLIPVPEVDLGPGTGSGVLDHVGQCLLHDPVGRQLDARGDLLGVAADPEIDRQPPAGTEAGVPASSAVADLTARVDSLEAQLRELSG